MDGFLYLPNCDSPCILAQLRYWANQGSLGVGFRRRNRNARQKRKSAYSCARTNLFRATQRTYSAMPQVKQEHFGAKLGCANSRYA